MQVLFYLIALLDRVSIGEVILVLSCLLEAARDAHGMLVLSGTHAGRVAHAGRTWGAGHTRDARRKRDARGHANRDVSLRKQQK